MGSIITQTRSPYLFDNVTWTPNQPTAPSGGFDPNPAPRSGQGAYGLVPGPIGIPNPAGDLAAQLPGLADANKAASDALLAKLGGQLSPGTLKQMQDYEAQFSARSGMPGSNAIPGTLGYNRGVRDIGTTSEAQTEQGLADYARLVQAVSGTQTVPPALQADIAGRNAAMAAAPDPFQQQNHAEQLYNEYLSRLRGPGGGTGTFGSPSAGTMPTAPTSTSTGGVSPGPAPYVPYGTNPADIEQDPDGTMWNRVTGEYLGQASNSPSGMNTAQNTTDFAAQNSPFDQFGYAPEELANFGDF